MPAAEAIPLMERTDADAVASALKVSLCIPPNHVATTLSICLSVSLALGMHLPRDDSLSLSSEMHFLRCWTTRQIIVCELRCRSFGIETSAL